MSSNRSQFVVLRTILLSLCLAFVACHADANDPAGQAKELSDPVRRPNAIGNLTRLYDTALDKAKGDRSASSVKTMVDQTVDTITKAYLANAVDTGGREGMMNLLGSMRDARAVPAFLEALKWRKEVSERSAIVAARAISMMQLNDADKTRCATALAEAVGRVEETRGVDNEMRIEFIRALGALKHPQATAALVSIAERQDETQSFLINRLALEQLVKEPTADHISTFLRALFVFDPRAPQNRANDLGTVGLVGIGEAAVQPLIKVLAGENAELNAIAAKFVNVLKSRGVAAPNLTREILVAGEATTSLGQTGLASALPALVAESKNADKERRFTAGIALASLALNGAERDTARTAFHAVLEASDKVQRPQLLVALQHVADPANQPLFLELAKRPEDELPDIRIIAARAFALLATKSEAAALRAVIRAEDPEGFQQAFEQNNSALDTAEACDIDVPCYIGKLSDANPEVAKKSAYMLMRLARGDARAIGAIVAKLDHPNDTVRAELLYALDAVATQGSPEGVAKIESIAKAEEGRSSWNRIKAVATQTLARVRARGPRAQ